MRARSRLCFDFSFYKERNARLFHLHNLSPADLWEHFVQYGQFELGAAHRCAALDTADVWGGALPVQSTGDGTVGRLCHAALTNL